MALTCSKPFVVSAVGPVSSLALSGTVYAGAPIGFTTGWVQAIASLTAPIPAEFIALEDGVSGDVISVTQEAIIIGGVTSATLGGEVYLSSTAGEYSETTTLQMRQVLGRVVTATQLHIHICQDVGAFQVQRVAADNSAFYVREVMTLATGSAYALRAYNSVLGVAAANAYGGHITLAFDAAGDVTGLGCGLRVTLESVASQVLQGTLCALQLDSFLGATVTFSGNAGAAFLRCTDIGATQMPFFLDITALTSGAAAAFTDTDLNHDTDSGVLRVNSAAGVRYIKLFT